MHHKLSSNPNNHNDYLHTKNRPAVPVRDFTVDGILCTSFGVIIRLILPLLGPDFSLACNLLNGAQGRTATSLPPTMDGPYRYSPERNTPAVMQ